MLSHLLSDHGYRTTWVMLQIFSFERESELRILHLIR